VFVLDVDGPEGERSLAALEERHGPKLPLTWIALTGKGRHLYFRWPTFEGAPVIRNSASRLGAGLDVRGLGGYVCAPPSLHPSGHRYTWSQDGGPLADAPVWLLDAITLGNRVHSLDERRPAKHWPTILAEGAQEGSRNATATSLAGWLFRTGIGEKFGPETVLYILLGWNRGQNVPPLTDDEITRVVSSVYKAHRRS
jgi:hypothetical protein